MTGECLLAFDRASVRSIDDNGFMHVAISPFTKEQVAPYYGKEIPGWKELGLDPVKVYYGYRPAEELSDPETVKSINGIPVQFRHHADFPDDPAHDTRVGAAGTDAEWKDPYLMNSLTIYDQQAQDAVNSGALRELSLAYQYTPDFKSSGEFKGQRYDFTMRRIRGNHVALVEEGRAGKDVLVFDSQIGSVTMSASEKIELLCAQILEALHEKDPATSEIVDAVDEAAPVEEIAEAKEEVKVETEETAEDAEEPVEAVAEAAEAEEAPAEDACSDAEDEEPAEEVVETEEAEKAILSEDETEEFSKSGLDLNNPELQRAFAMGVKYGEAKEKAEPKKLDSEHESEGIKKLLGEDANLSIDNLAKIVCQRTEARCSAKHSAAEDVRGVLGRIKLSAYDDASGIYQAACKSLGLKCTKDSARDVFMAYGSMQKTLAQDSAKAPQDAGVLGRLLGNIKQL